MPDSDSPIWFIAFNVALAALAWGCNAMDNTTYVDDGPPEYRPACGPTYWHTGIEYDC